MWSDSQIDAAQEMIVSDYTPIEIVLNRLKEVAAESSDEYLSVILGSLYSHTAGVFITQHAEENDITLGQFFAILEKNK